MKFDTQTLKLFNLFEKITRAKLKTITELKDRVVFIVEVGNLKKALGKNSENVVKLEESLNRKIKILEFNSNPLRFTTNLMFPLKIVEISMEEDGVIVIKGPDAKTKGLMIGAKAQNLRAYERIVSEFFDIKEIKVI